MKTNRPLGIPRTAEGAPAVPITPEQELSRLLAACLLWEDGFYESGVEVAGRIKELVPQCNPDFLYAVAVEARNKQKLRHAPLMLAREMARHKGMRKMVKSLLGEIIQRADELSEFVAIYWKDGRQPLSAGVKKGLAKAFLKFDEYQLAKYNRDNAVKLRDVLFLCHAKPDNKDREALWKRLVDGTLQTPDTWEVALSAGNDKRGTFERLMRENNLGALAFLRNLRNMRDAGVQYSLIESYAKSLDIRRVLPFRFIGAARAVPDYERVLEPLMLRACKDRPRFKGTTRLLIDVSGSMDAQISARSDITRLDAACGVAILLRELCEHLSIHTFSNNVVDLATTTEGFSLARSISGSQAHGGTRLGAAVSNMNSRGDYTRLIVLTDEQSHDVVGDPRGRGYMINVASNRNGVGYGSWLHIDGWSEAVIDYLHEIEAMTSK